MGGTWAGDDVWAQRRYRRRYTSSGYSPSRLRVFYCPD